MTQNAFCQNRSHLRLRGNELLTEFASEDTRILVPRNDEAGKLTKEGLPPPMTPGASEQRCAGVQARRRLGGSEEVLVLRLRDLLETSETHFEVRPPPLDGLVIVGSVGVCTTSATATTVSLCGRKYPTSAIDSFWMETDQMRYTRYYQLPIKIGSSAQAKNNFLMEVKPDMVPLFFVACTINCFWMETMNCNLRKLLSMTIVKPEALVVQLNVSGWKQIRSTKELLIKPDTNYQ
jgi:hypothetical protein